MNPSNNKPSIPLQRQKEATAMALRLVHCENALQSFASGQVDAVVGPGGKPYFLRSSQNELSESVRGQKDLAQKAEVEAIAKRDRLAVISHEIRTPVTGIMGFCELLATHPSLPEDCRDFVNTIATSSEALLHVLDDFLEFSRLENGGLELEKTTFPSRKTLGDIHALLTPNAARKGITLSMKVEDDVPDSIWNDAGRLRQVLLNLAGNAIKFTSSGSVILGLRAVYAPSDGKERRVEYFVRDTGPGLTLDQMEIIFEPFVQADASVSRRFGGTGLGLSISRTLAQLMGGTLTVKSAPGKGAEFVLNLPVDGRVQPGTSQPQS